MWSESKSDTNNVFKSNTIQVPVFANGLAIYGGSANSASDNYVADTVCEGGGLQVSNRFQSVPVDGTTTLDRNTLVRCGSPNRQNNGHNGAIWFWAEQAGLDTPILISNTIITDSSYAGVTFWGSSVSGTKFSYVNISVSPWAFEVQGPGGVVTTDHVVASGLTLGSVRLCGGMNFDSGVGDSGWNSTGNRCA